jgi:hypothetical protein
LNVTLARYSPLHTDQVAGTGNIARALRLILGERPT